MSNIFIPKKIRIGFQNRSDTYTQKLAYVIYYDEAGKIRKETSWKSWCDKSIPSIEMENKPTSGFVLNKGVKRYGGYFGSGRSMVRIHHPDNFEFEVTVTNLMGILAHSDVSKRDIVEQCIFAWEGGELILLPVNSEEYKEAMAFTEKQDKKLSARDLVPGRQYFKKKSDETATYVGYYNWYEFASTHEDGRSLNRSGWHTYYEKLTTRKQVNKGKKHIFWDGSSFITPSVGTFAGEISMDIVENFANIVDEFFKTQNSQKIIGYQFEPLKDEDFSYKYGDKLFTLDTGKNEFECVDFPYSFASSFHHYGRHDEFGLVKNKSSFKTNSDFEIFNNSAHTEKIVVPYDYKGDQPQAMGPEDVKKAEHGYMCFILSKRVAAFFRDNGIGHMEYILENGNLAKIA